MKAALIKEPERMEIVAKERPTRGAGETLIRVARVGVCGSDLHFYTGHNPFAEYPRVLGHECSGVVAEADPESDFRRGDKITVDPVLNCGQCYACRIGKPNICENLKVFGVHTDGAMGEYVSVPTNNLYKSEGAQLDSLALAEPLSIGLQANTRGETAEGDTVTIIGAGTIGLMCLFVAKRVIGAERVISLDILENRLEFARLLGADVTLNPEAEDFADRYAEATEGVGAEVTIEAVGKPATVKRTLELTAPAGRIVILGISTDPVEFTTGDFIGRELEVVGSRLNTGQFPRALKVLESKGDSLKKLITHRLGLEKLEQAFRLMSESPAETLKVMLEVSD